MQFTAACKYVVSTEADRIVSVTATEEKQHRT
jgi:hypothetical protein